MSSKYKLECISLTAENFSRRLTVHVDSEKDDELSFSFSLPLVNFEKVEIVVGVEDIHRYPKEHSFSIRLKSPLRSRIDEELLSYYLSRMETKGETITEVVKSVETMLTGHTRYGGSTLPIPDEKTTVVAVLGSSMLLEDDWLASDYCLLHGALGGTARKEIWLACEELPEYSKKILPLVHDSHVAFDDTVKAFTTFIDQTDLARSFLDRLEDASLNAASGDKILVVIVAHEQQESEFLEIGNSFVSRDAVELAFAGTADGVEITIVVTSCFSGIWAVPFDNPKSSALAGSTKEAPYYALAASGYCRGGRFTQTVVDGFSKLRDRVASSDDSESWTYLFASPLERIIPIEDFISKTPHSILAEYFQSYVKRVIKSAHRVQWLAAVVSCAPEMYTIEDLRSEVLGGRDELSTLFRIVSLLELPREATFSCIPLAVGTFTSRRRTAGIKLGPWAAAAQVHYEVLAGRCPGPETLVGNIPISRYADLVKGECSPRESAKSWFGEFSCEIGVTMKPRGLSRCLARCIVKTCQGLLTGIGKNRFGNLQNPKLIASISPH
ncbi:hypothetical protein BD410DRAFT_69567 [Rickenella mellea]|uniref:Uncharacterized protein n=1 Tax=Rickenella mellea TaxID=50990 RepID=A0A4Y7QBA0_9AGAM|nr:hypothetical protein BD410DRAFT_69567 [Rickenella mellea]